MGDGRLEVFFVSSDGGLHYYRQSSANVDNWMPMEAMKTGLNEISAAQNYDGSVELFAVGNDKNLYALRESAPNVDSWNAWYQLQGGNGVSVTAGKYGDGRLGVFFVSSDGGIHYYNQSSPNVDNWTAMEVMTTGLLAITAAQNYDGSIELFGVGNDFANNASGGYGYVYARREAAPNVDAWNAWYRIPGGATSITAVQNQDTRIHLAYVGSPAPTGGHTMLYYHDQSSPNIDNWKTEEYTNAGLHI